MSPTRPLFPRRRLMQAAAALCTLGAAGALQAQPTPWPSKPIRLVVGFAPGGTTDVLARILAQSLSESLGQPVLVDNKPGAGGNIAVSEVIRAAPDGHTFLVAPTSVETVNPWLFKSNLLPSRDLSPVAGIGRTQMYLVTRPQLPVKNARELVALAKSQPGKLSYASAGAGTPPHLAGELFKLRTGVFVTHIPYRGAAPALQDVLSGQADFVFDPGIAFQHIRAGKVKLVAVASAKRSPFFPDVPTVAEQGFTGAELDIWFGAWAPNGTPADIGARVSREIAKALGQAAVKARYGDLGAEPIALDTPEFRGLLAQEGKTLAALIKEQGITAN